jgi:glycosyltransferase involved in cell wall biosynthesis
MARICIDGFNLGMPRGSGIATYARNLQSNLGAMGHETQILFSSTLDEDSTDLMRQVTLLDAGAVAPSNKVRAVIRSLARPPRLQAWEVTRTPDVITREIEARFPPCDTTWVARNVFDAANRAYFTFGWMSPITLGKAELRTDLTHWTCALPLYEPRTPNFYTLHDLVPLRLPFTTLDNKRGFYGLCKALIAKGDRIITVSEHSRADIIRMLGAPEDKVVNTYQSVEVPDALLKATDDDVANQLDATFDLPWRGYYLFFGAIEPKKNLPRIVEAYLSSGVKAPLVIIGGRAWLKEQQGDLLYDDLVQASVLQDGVLKRADRVRQYEYMPFRLLVSLIRGARATLFPSLYEGFGLPVLESMLLGTPVLTSTAGSLPEIAGEAAIMVDPYDVDAIRSGIRTLDADEALRDDLGARGRQQASKFSPERYRERLAEAYRPFL